MADVDLSVVDTVVCDIDGVVLLGSHAIDGVGAALHSLRRAGLDVLFVTNNSTKTRATIAERISEVVGFEADAGSVINSGWATGCFIAGDVDSVYVLGTDGLRETLRDADVNVTTDWRAADAVVVGLDFDVTFGALRDAALAVQNGATFFATNSDPSYPTRDGLYPGAGALVAVVATTTGRSPIVCGKPHAPMQHLLEEIGGQSPLMVGDRPETDMALGKAMGWATALVLTGVTRRAADVPDSYRPDLVLDSLAELPGRLGIE